MKRISLIIVFLLSGVSLAAQVDRSNNWLARINYNQNFLTMGYSNDIERWSVGGASVDFGGKQFFNKDLGWFIEESAEFFLTDLPMSKRVSYGAWAREIGIGAVILSGYDFVIKDNMSLEVFGGVVYRRLLYNKIKLAGTVIRNGEIQDNNLRLKIGAGLNYKKYNFSFSLSPDLLNREREDGGWHAHYTTIQIGLGVGYYF